MDDNLLNENLNDTVNKIENDSIDIDRVPEPAPENQEPVFITHNIADILSYDTAPITSPEATDGVQAEQANEANLKASLIRAKAEYKALKEEERAARIKKYEEEHGPRKKVGAAIIAAVLSSVLCFALLTAFVFLFPTRDSSLFATLAKKYASTMSDSGRTSNPAKIGDTEIAPGSDVTINVEGEFSASAAYAKASPSVVAIVTAKTAIGSDGALTETSISQGAGIVVSDSGEILTNYHVLSSVIDTNTRGIAEGNTIYVYFDSPLSRPYEAVSIIGFDAEFDLALIKINKTDLKPIEFFDSDKLTVGESVIAIGSPGGLDFMGSVCDGIISGLKRTVVSSDSGATLYDMIQMTAPINPGNSGGAVVNSSGQLVGISVIKIVADNYENMAFAISSNTAARLIDSFRKYGKYVKPLLGVTIDTRYGWRDAEDNGWPIGAFVVEVSEGSGAGKAGIIAGDIICSINGKETLDYTSLRTYLLKFAPDDEVTFKVYRTSDGKYYEFKVKLTAA
ncbi:MAG: trypsin-like peptidase domain-containing protein [Clostridia bacterium]|nr:trypsin-like peptidase domain-containing protein [Clostridia bacterium]